VVVSTSEVEVAAVSGFQQQSQIHVCHGAKRRSHIAHPLQAGLGCIVRRIDLRLDLLPQGGDFEYPLGVRHVRFRTVWDMWGGKRLVLSLMLLLPFLV